MTVYTPVRIFVAGALAIMAAAAGLSTIVSDALVIAFTIGAFVALFALLFGILVWTDGEPQPISSQLPRRIYDAQSYEGSPR